MSLANFAKILKCSGEKDMVTMKAEDNGDTVTFMFENEGGGPFPARSRLDWRPRPTCWGLPGHRRPADTPASCAPQPRTGSPTLSSS